MPPTPPPDPPSRPPPSPATGGQPPLDLERMREAGAALGLGAELGPEALARFERYAAEILSWNARLNLTRITAPEAMAVQHFLDSLICLRAIPGDPAAALDCIDVGAGAGLPGLALKIVRPAWRLTLVESVAKKAAFLEHAVAALALEGVTVLADRAERLGRDPAHRGRYDLALARAVARLPVLAEYLLPFLKPGGRMLALKGAAIEDELAAMRPALAALGARLLKVEPYGLPGLDQPRALVVVEKRGPTPAAYPRRPGEPERAPIGARPAARKRAPRPGRGSEPRSGRIGD